ncbi:uncharacterized protein LOC134826019 isoform X1 [Bolinopsis microptera]|uniref:uncharacterized protein LOC134826019 isoform X1 n=1 Tax=Bolinopsis microptera TaxID=2820187 RepID=UPI003078A82E
MVMDWQIYVRVTKVHGLRRYSNARGSGFIFKVNLMDNSGEIVLMGFDEVAQQFASIFLEDACYKISDCRINIQRCGLYTAIDHKHELVLEFFTQISPIAAFQPKFTPRLTLIKEIPNLSNDILFINTIGIISDAEDPFIYSAKSGRQTLRRNIKLVDRSGYPVWLAVYGNQASEISDAVLNEQVILIKDVKIVRFGENKFNLHMWFQTSIMLIEPSGKKAEDLRVWWKAERNNERQRLMIGHDSIDPETHQTNSTPATLVTESFVQVEERISSCIAKGSKGEEYFNLIAVATIIKRENVIYAGCPVLLCRKKVTEITQPTSSGNQPRLGYFCRNCNETYNHFKYGFAVKLFLKDYSGGRWVTIFNDAAEEFLGQSPDELIKLREDLSGFDFEHVMNKNLFKRYVFRLKSYVSNFFEDHRIEYNVISLTKPEPRSISYGLIKEILTLEST